MTGRRRLPHSGWSLIPALLIALFLGGALAARAAQPGAQIANFSFTPDPLTVRVGDTVTWTNADSAPHTVTANNRAFDSGTLSPGQSFSFTAAAAGTFDYRCTIHPFMKGVLVVEGGASATAPASPTAAAARDGTAAQVASPVAAPSRAGAAKAYVGLVRDNAVAVVESETNRVLGTIPVPPGPHGLALTPDGRTVYVSSDGASTVSVIDTATDRVVGSIEVGPEPHGLALTPDGRRLLVAGWGADMVVIVDTASNRVVGQVPVPNPHNIAVSPDGRVAYAGAQRAGATALAILDLAGQTQVGSVPLDRAPRALNFSPDGTQLHFTVAGVDAVQVLDPAGNRVVAQIATGASPHQPLFTPDGRYSLVGVQGPGELALIDPATDSVSGTVAVGRQPNWIAVSADGRTAYVTNQGSNDVSVVDLAARRVTATIPVGNAPRQIVLQSAQGAMPTVPRAGAGGAASGSLPLPWIAGAGLLALTGAAAAAALRRRQI